MPGWVALAATPQSAAWAAAARRVAEAMPLLPRRHGGTWFAGVDALPNARDGSISGVPFAGPWEALPDFDPPAAWHPAQLSVVFPGYPRRDADESDAAHAFRRDRDAAHVDGLLPEGPRRRRHLREPHAFILGVALGDSTQSPLVVWPGSQKIIHSAFAAALRGIAPAQWGDVDVTEAYQAARRTVFATCPRVTVPLGPGGAVWLHRHLLHGVAPWGDAPDSPPRMMAYFRPLLADPADWL